MTLPKLNYGPLASIAFDDQVSASPSSAATRRSVCKSLTIGARSLKRAFHPQHLASLRIERLILTPAASDSSSKLVESRSNSNPVRSKQSTTCSRGPRNITNQALNNSSFVIERDCDAGCCFYRTSLSLHAGRRYETFLRRLACNRPIRVRSRYLSGRLLHVHQS